MDLKELRGKIDEIDDKLICLFQQRMNISADIALYKFKNNIQVYDPAREQKKLCDLSSKVNKEHEAYVSELFSLLFRLSRTEQERILNFEENI